MQSGGDSAGEEENTVGLPRGDLHVVLEHPMAEGTKGWTFSACLGERTTDNSPSFI